MIKLKEAELTEVFSDSMPDWVKDGLTEARFPVDDKGYKRIKVLFNQTERIPNIEGKQKRNLPNEHGLYKSYEKDYTQKNAYYNNEHKKISYEFRDIGIDFNKADFISLSNDEVKELLAKGVSAKVYKNLVSKIPNGQVLCLFLLYSYLEHWNQRLSKQMVLVEIFQDGQYKYPGSKNKSITFYPKAEQSTQYHSARNYLDNIGLNTLLKTDGLLEACYVITDGNLVKQRREREAEKNFYFQNDRPYGQVETSHNYISYRTPQRPTVYDNEYDYTKSEWKTKSTRRDNYDKSGYLLNPNKYRDLFNKLSQNNALKFLNKYNEELLQYKDIIFNYMMKNFSNVYSDRSEIVKNGTVERRPEQENIFTYYKFKEDVLDLFWLIVYVYNFVLGSLDSVKANCDKYGLIEKDVIDYFNKTFMDVNDDDSTLSSWRNPFHSFINSSDDLDRLKTYGFKTNKWFKEKLAELRNNLNRFKSDNIDIDEED